MDFKITGTDGTFETAVFERIASVRSLSPRASWCRLWKPMTQPMPAVRAIARIGSIVLLTMVRIHRRDETTGTDLTPLPRWRAVAIISATGSRL